MRVGEQLYLVGSAVMNSGKRTETVSGTFKLVFHGRELPVPVSQLRQVIRDVDAQAPWKDESLYDKDPKSIHYFFDNGGVMNNWGPGMEDCSRSFTIEPEISILRKGQVHAYQKYLENLCRLLLMRSLPSLKEIQVTMNVRQMMFFRPTPLDRTID